MRMDAEDPERETLEILRQAKLLAHRNHRQGHDTATIVTTAPSEDFSAIHHREPVVLVEADWGPWLDPMTPIPELQALHRACPDELLEVRAGSPKGIQA
jgi:putative SOS response-associated peptidase YedK